MAAGEEMHPPRRESSGGRLVENRGAQFYDVISDPHKRLAHEGQFLLDLMSLAPGRRVLDTAAATGVHAEFLARGGAQVTARDVDRDALEYARAHRANPSVMYEQGDMREAAGGPFDLVICMGNSLSMLPAREDVARALRAMAAQAAPRGVAFVHVINYAGIEEGAPRQKVARKALADGEIVVVKDMVPTGRGGPVLVSFSYFLKTGDSWQAWGEQATLQNLSRECLEYAAGEAGFAIEGEYGDYDCSPYDAATSPDLLVVLRKR